MQDLLGSTGVSAILRLAVVRHPAKEFYSAWFALNYGQLLADHLGRRSPVTLAEVLADTNTARVFVQASEKLAGASCEKRLFNRQARCSGSCIFQFALLSARV